MKNEVQLIAYADRLGGTLRGTLDLLQGPLAGLFGGIHLLPFFDPIDGADAGFDPIDHTSVDEQLGNWDDVRSLAGTADVMADLIVNHISSRSPQFLDFCAHGSDSDYNGMFLTFDQVFPRGASAQDLLAIYRPRPALPFSPMTLADGTRQIFWTTFTTEQIDINVRHPRGREYLTQILDRFAQARISSIRLDAVGYAIKAAGQNCFMMPETFAFIEDLTALAKQRGLEVLVEVHSHYQRQIEIARCVDWVYDFALPPLILHAIFHRNAHTLKHWLRIRPTNAVTVLDTHDGIGIIDIGSDSQDREKLPGLIPDTELDALVDRIHMNSNGESRQASGESAANLDLYQVNCTYYDALHRDDLNYLISRAIQFFVPGIPQVYYVGLFAGRNDVELLKATGVGRDINRHRYTKEEITREIERPVVSRLMELIRLRNTHAAFSGDFRLTETTDSVLELIWQQGEEFARLFVDFESGSYEIRYTQGGSEVQFPLN